MRDAIVIRTTHGASAQVALASKSIAFFYSEFFDGIQLNKDSLNNVLVSCPADKLPGFSHGAGFDRVVAATSVDAGPSIPFTMAETRQR